MSKIATLLINVLYCLNFIKCEILFWGHSHLHNVAPSPLSLFNNNDLNVLIEILRPNSVLAFVIENRTEGAFNNLVNSYRPMAKMKLPLFRQLVENSRTVYVPQNLPIYIGNFSVVLLDGSDDEIDNKLTKIYNQFILDHKNQETLAFLINTNSNDEHIRNRRAAAKPPENGPGLYYVKDKAMMYSSLYPVLRMNENGNDTEYILRKSAIETADVRDQVTRLIITFSLEEASKVVLRFRFVSTNNGYWSLSVVELQDINHKDWVLTTTQKIVAQKGFSYHCSGSTVFENGTTSLILTNFQVQPSPIAQKRFADAYDCVPFTTIPIWSGLLVTALLGAALIFAITAITNIRTMDRFDDPKGQPLTLNVE